MSLYIGLMSGTSMDAVDAALVDFAGPVPRLVAARSHDIPEDLRSDLLAVLTSETISRSTLWSTDARVGELFAGAATALLEDARIAAEDVVAIGSHGQTIFHDPHAPVPCTVQIGDPNIVAERTSITTVADLRRRDLAAGGEGAPLAPAFHHAVFHTRETDRAVVNIGGIANLTVLPAAGAVVLGLDTGPGNTLIDAWMREHCALPMDRDAGWAATGACDAALLAALEDDPYFRLPPPKSTGRELFHLGWLRARLAGLDRPPSPQDVQHTLCVLTAATIANAVTEHAPATGELLVCGGGVHNPLVMGELARRLAPVRVVSTGELGFEPDWIEAMAFAWLAKQTMEGKPGNLPTVTGAAHPVVLGGIYPGRPPSP